MILTQFPYTNRKPKLKRIGTILQSFHQLDETTRCTREAVVSLVM